MPFTASSPCYRIHPCHHSRHRLVFLLPVPQLPLLFGTPPQVSSRPVVPSNARKPAATRTTIPAPSNPSIVTWVGFSLAPLRHAVQRGRYCRHRPIHMPAATATTRNPSNPLTQRGTTSFDLIGPRDPVDRVSALAHAIRGTSPVPASPTLLPARHPATRRTHIVPPGTCHARRSRQSSHQQ